MRHPRALGVSIVVTLVLAALVLVARDQFLALGDADASQTNAPTEITATATELPLVNLVRTSDGQTVAIPADSLASSTHGDDDDAYEHDDDDDDDDHDEHDDDDEDDDHDENEDDDDD